MSERYSRGLGLPLNYQVLGIANVIRMKLINLYIGLYNKCFIKLFKVYVCILVLIKNVLCVMEKPLSAILKLCYQ